MTPKLKNIEFKMLSICLKITLVKLRLESTKLNGFLLKIEFSKYIYILCNLIKLSWPANLVVQKSWSTSLADEGFLSTNIFFF